jgi:hypothetical protein
MKHSLQNLFTSTTKWMKFVKKREETLRKTALAWWSLSLSLSLDNKKTYGVPNIAPTFFPIFLFAGAAEFFFDFLIARLYGQKRREDITLPHLLGTHIWEKQASSLTSHDNLQREGKGREGKGREGGGG